VNEPTTAGEWNAGAYHRVSDPQFQWGLRVLERVPLHGTERVLDAGCGTGRLTRVLAERVPAGVVVGCDLSENMVRTAAATLGVRSTVPDGSAIIGVVRANLLALPWRQAFDIAFSTATFHWVTDHQRLFAELRGVLVARGVLEAQCGGGPNLARVHARAKALLSTPRYRPYYEDWRDPWLFASAEETEERLRRAGFGEVRCWLEDAPTTFRDAATYRAFVEAVVMRPFLVPLPLALRESLLDSLVADARTDDPAFTLDYWRLNISAVAA
jgi:trans-aconitate 2-methyltransferase